VTTTQHLLVE